MSESKIVSSQADGMDTEDSTKEMIEKNELVIAGAEKEPYVEKKTSKMVVSEGEYEKKKSGIFDSGSGSIIIPGGKNPIGGVAKSLADHLADEVTKIVKEVKEDLKDVIKKKEVVTPKVLPSWGPEWFGKTHMAKKIEIINTKNKEKLCTMAEIDDDPSVKQLVEKRLKEIEENRNETVN